MAKTSLVVCVVASLAPPVRGQEIEDLLDTVLEAAITHEGLVRYDKVSTSPDLDSALEMIAEFDAVSLVTDAERLAFWINAYNAHMLSQMAVHPEREDVLGDDDGAIFFETPVRVAGRSLSLNEIEHGVLRLASKDSSLVRLGPSTLDPRIHVALNCAAISCPRLWPESYRAERLDDQLDRGMRAFVNGEQHISLADGRLRLSALLDWFGQDFDVLGEPAGTFLLRYMSQDRLGYSRLHPLLAGQSASDLRASGAQYEYDWAVNRSPTDPR